MPKGSVLKPSAYDVVIRNRNAIRRLNAKIGAAKTAAAYGRLVDEKDRLMREMWAACPHGEIAHCEGAKTSLGPDPMPMRVCVCCGESELEPNGTFEVLKRKRGRKLTRFDPQAFAVKLGQTLLATGINIKRS